MHIFLTRTHNGAIASGSSNAALWSCLQFFPLSFFSIKSWWEDKRNQAEAMRRYVMSKEKFCCDCRHPKVDFSLSAIKKWFRSGSNKKKYSNLVKFRVCCCYFFVCALIPWNWNPAEAKATILKWPQKRSVWISLPLKKIQLQDVAKNIRIFDPCLAL